MHDRTGRSVTPKLASALANALDAMLDEHGFSASHSEGSGLAFNLEAPDGEPVGMSFPRATEVLDRVALGEMRFADVNGAGAAETGGCRIGSPSTRAHVRAAAVSTFATVFLSA